MIYSHIWLNLVLEDHQPIQLTHEIEGEILKQCTQPFHMLCLTQVSTLLQVKQSLWKLAFDG
jgi:hypothetical protein